MQPDVEETIDIPTMTSNRSNNRSLKHQIFTPGCKDKVIWVCDNDSIYFQGTLQNYRFLCKPSVEV